MLKIKDDVYLKYLEKFGFTEEDGYYVTLCNTTDFKIFISSGTGNISIDNKTDCTILDDLDIIFDMIKAGIVEKVDDGNS